MRPSFRLNQNSSLFRNRASDGIGMPDTVDSFQIRASRFGSYPDLHSACRNPSRSARLLDGHDLLKGLKSSEPLERFVYHHVEAIFERRLLRT
jgi:hypothetical protein